MWIIIPLAIIVFLLIRGFSFATMLGVVVMAMITGGIGYALGNLIGGGWAIYGAILGALLGLFSLIGAKTETQ